MPSLPIPGFLEPWLGSSPRAALLFYAVALVLFLLLLVGMWLVLGKGPRQRRALRRVGQLLRQRSWKEALTIVRDLQTRRQPSAWQKRLSAVEADCQRTAGKELLAQKEYERGLEHFLRAAQLNGQSETDARSKVAEAILAEVRQVFALTSEKDTGPILELIVRVLLIQSPCPEASFWQALCQVREGNSEQAIASLRSLVGSEEAGKAKRFIDPPLYLGALLLRRGEPREALRFLTDANRVDSGCPFVTSQLGAAMVESGGDPQIAVRAIQRALGPRGFQLWTQTPSRAWIEGFPETQSYVRRLAAQHTYVCPLWGAGLDVIQRQANTALAEGLYRLGNYQAAADVFTRLSHESAPSLAVLRGLGLALARLEHYDQAFKHLRAAHELGPDDRTVAGYLALCAARAKPLRPEDKAANIAWAIWLVGKFSAPGDVEWAGLLNAVFAEARANGVAVSVQDQVHLCDELASVRATDASACEAYHYLQTTAPEALRPEFAWLYCRAAQLNRLSGDHAVDLFARTFRDGEAARTFYAQQGWEFEDIEHAYLERAAGSHPGQFPEALGPDYPARGEAMLLERSRRLEQAGQIDAAVACAEVLVKLAPRRTVAHDRLAQLHYRRGDLDRSLALLKGWQRLEPENYRPAMRQAVICRQRDDAAGCISHIRAALALTAGRLRGEVAFVGARLLLGLTLADLDGKTVRAKEDWPEDMWREVLALLEECLHDVHDHAQALWCAAAVRAMIGEPSALAAQAAIMNRPDVDDARFHYLAAVCHLAAGDHASALAACERANADPTLAVESAYLAGWACIQKRDPATAALAFQRVAQATDSPSAVYAQAIVGAIRFHQGAYGEAVEWWQRMDPERRKALGFAEPLSATVFLAAIEDYQSGRFEQAADKLREAGKLGLRDRRLGPLLSLSLFKAGQQMLYEVVA